MSRISGYLKQKQPKTCVWISAVGKKGILQRSQLVLSSGRFFSMAFFPAKKEHSWVLLFQTFLTLNCLSGEVMMVAAAKLFALVAANIQLKRSERIGRDGFILFGVSVGF